MSKRHRNAPGPGHFKVQGHVVEDNDTARKSKQALVREASQLKERGQRKRAAPKKARRAPSVVAKTALPETPDVLARAHDREFARMNERKPPKRVKAAADDGHPGYLTEAARGVIRRVARVALAPLALARAAIDRIRDRD
jgi:hypothetical protein